MIQITLKGGTVKEYENPVSAADVAKDIGMGLYKAACVAKINGEVCDLRTMIYDNCELEILTFDDEDGKKTFRHTASHGAVAHNCHINHWFSPSRFLCAE